MNILITGGAGFVGSHVVEHILKNTDWNIIVLDRLNYASMGYDRLRDIKVFDGNRVRVFSADFTKPIQEGLANEIGPVDYILHMGAESHVDNSITDPEKFVRANVLGTMHVLNFARLQKDLKLFIYFSTDEVFGPAPEGVFHKEWDRYNAGNPYAATKAGGEELALAFSNTYRLPVIITHTMNVFGERQHPEKFIPLVIRKVLEGETVTIHANKDKTQAGKRHYIHARNVGAALMFLINKWPIFERTPSTYNEGYYGPHFLNPGFAPVDKFNIVGEQEVDNLTLAQKIAEIVGKQLSYEMVDFHSSRPGHDLRYALDGTKMRELGWSLPKTFEESLVKTVEWTLENRSKWIYGGKI